MDEQLRLVGIEYDEQHHVHGNEHGTMRDLGYGEQLLRQQPCLDVDG
jgi:hypothetical protein